MADIIIMTETYRSILQKPIGLIPVTLMCMLSRLAFVSLADGWSIKNGKKRPHCQSPGAICTGQRKAQQSRILAYKFRKGSNQSLVLSLCGKGGPSSLIQASYVTEKKRNPRILFKVPEFCYSLMRREFLLLTRLTHNRFTTWWYEKILQQTFHTFLDGLRRPLPSPVDSHIPT